QPLSTLFTSDGIRFLPAFTHDIIERDHLESLKSAGKFFIKKPLKITIEDSEHRSFESRDLCPVGGPVSDISQRNIRLLLNMGKERTSVNMAVVGYY
ncbi:hypothetical protein J6590_045943, partial [Homalodisca vitripennis]